MGRNFYSGTESELAAGAANVVTIVTPAVATYGVTAGIMTTYSTQTTTFTNLLALTQNRATRTEVAVENKNVAKTALKKASANLAKIFIATSTVTNGMLLALNMNERLIPTPRPVPATPPSIDILSVINRLVNVHLHDPESESRGLPFGAVSANIFSFVGPTPPEDPRLFHFEGATSRAKCQIQFPESIASGSKIWLTAGWVSARGQRSVGCQPVSFTLQGGDATEAV